MTNTLFKEDLGDRTAEPLQDVEITTTILYMSKGELAEFKRLAKEGIKRMYGEAFQQKGNLTDYIIHLIKKDNETK